MNTCTHVPGLVVSVVHACCLTVDVGAPLWNSISLQKEEEKQNQQTNAIHHRTIHTLLAFPSIPLSSLLPPLRPCRHDSCGSAAVGAATSATDDGAS